MLFSVIYCCLYVRPSLPVYTGSCQNFDDFKFSCLDEILGYSVYRQDVSHFQFTPEVADVENGRPCYCCAIRI